MIGNGPLVSIIINCFNGEKYLDQAIESILAQTYKNWELVFWDNQSSDKSAEIFHGYNDCRLRYYVSPIHTSLYEARNLAIEKVCGEFIAFLDVDDFWVPEKLEKQMPLFKDRKVGIVYGNYWILNECNGQKNIASKNILPSGRIKNKLLRNYLVGVLTIVVRREVFVNEVVFNGEYDIIGDFDMVIRVADKWKLGCIQDPVAYFRWHQNNLTRNTQLYIQELESWSRLMRKRKKLTNISTIYIKYHIQYLKLYRSFKKVMSFL